MNIPELREKIKEILGHDELFYALIIVFVGLASFGLGRASVGGGYDETRPEPTAPEPQITITEAPAEAQPALEAAGEEMNAAVAANSYVASKNSDKYHLPWCSGAQRISEANKIWFSSKAEAEAAGYTPAANCKGL